MEKKVSYFDIGFKLFLAVVAAATAYVFITQRQQNDDVKLVLELATSGEQAKAIAGLALAKVYAEEGRIPAAVYASIITYANVAPDPKVRQAANASAATAVKDNAVIARDVGRALDVLPADAFPARVYFHIAQEGDRDAAKRIETKLEVRGAAIPDQTVTVPSIEMVGGNRSPSANELRCFRRAECDNLGKRLEAFFQRNGVAIALKDLSARYEQSSAIRRNHFEVWFATGLAGANPS
jgi:hypothetical protein